MRHITHACCCLRPAARTAASALVAGGTVRMWRGTAALLPLRSKRAALLLRSIPRIPFRNVMDYRGSHSSYKRVHKHRPPGGGKRSPKPKHNWLVLLVSVLVGVVFISFNAAGHISEFQTQSLLEIYESCSCQIVLLRASVVERANEAAAVSAVRLEL